MLLLVNFGRKRPWEKNKNKAHIPRGEGKNTGPHPGGTRPVSEVTFWRVGPRPERWTMPDSSPRSQMGSFFRLSKMNLNSAWHRVGIQSLFVE